MIHAREDYNRFQDPAGIIPEDEPVFILRAQDACAADTLRFWAKYNIDIGGNAEISQVVSDWADIMDAWPKKKLADL